MSIELKSKYDYSRELWVFKSDILGSVAKWCIRQSPYDYPENLLVILTALSGIITPNHDKGLAGMVKFTGYELRSALQIWLEQIPEFMELNNRKNGRDGNGWLSRFDNRSSDPDDDFIDLEALYRNVVHDIITEAP